jgi:hypothetical protein
LVITFKLLNLFVSLLNLKENHSLRQLLSARRF